MSAISALLKFLSSNKILRVDVDARLVESAQEGVIRYLALKGFIKEHEALQALSSQLKLEYLNLEDPSLNQKLQVDRFANKLASRLVWQAKIIPLFEVTNEVVVATSNPFDNESMTSIGFGLGKSVKMVLAEESKILALLARFFPQQHVKISPAVESTENEGVDVIDERQGEDELSNDTAPIIKLANKIIADAVRLGASDIHLEPNENNLSVRFRIDGILKEIITIPKQIRRNLVIRLKVIAGMDISERRRPQDGRIRVSIGKRRADIRVSSIPVAAGEKLVLRLLSADYSRLTFADLSMPADVQKRFEVTLRRQGKMVLVCGPTGSGKTTTLYVALNHLSDRCTNITTIEDPVEYKFEHLNQIQINSAVGIGFASILRAVLRQDPDIMMIGEIRDTETLQIVVQAAQTGHLVLSTVHTNDAPSAVARLLDLGADPFNLSTSLASVLAQRLVRKLCESCKTTIAPGSLNEFQLYLNKYKIDPAVLKVGAGCEDCLYSGYKGQQGIFSYLEVNDQISELIYNRASIERLAAEAREHGYLGLDEAAAELVKAGITSFAEALPFLNLEPFPVKVPEPAAPVPQPTPVSAAVPELRIHVDHGGHSISQVSGATQSAPIQSPRILIVDDNKSVRKMLCALLRNEMVIIDEAQNGREALEKVYQHPPSLVICDLKMPEMDGKEFLSRVHSNKRTRDIPVIMLTVDDSEEAEIELIERGAVEFLSKRSAPTLLVNRIRRVLDRL